MDQYRSTCGVTSAEMLLHYYGKDVTARQIWAKGDIDNVELGSWLGELRTALQKLGVYVKWYHRGTIEHLMMYVRENRPPIVLLRYSDTLHYSVVVGYDKPRNANLASHIIIADPNNFYRIMPRETFLKARSLNRNTLDSSNLKGFDKWASKGATFAVGKLTRRNHFIVPKYPPTHHFPPNWSQMKATMVIGDKSWNPRFKTRHWERTFSFPERFRSYRASGVKPLLLRKSSSWGTRAYMKGSKAD